MSELKRTPLFDAHVALGARIVPFAGYEMPVQYKGLQTEHAATRNNIGLFDVSHMGEIRVRGANALKTLEWLSTNNVSLLKAGFAQYGLLMNADGGLIDDIIVYCIEENSDYLVCVNAANRAVDWEFFKAQNKSADLKDESEEWGQLAVQGPKALELLTKLFPKSDLLQMKAFQHRYLAEEKTVLAARTGYTGEDGFEFFIPVNRVQYYWDLFVNEGKVYGLEPVGLGARDTLRLEVKYPLYGHELDAKHLPQESGVGWAVKAAAKDFHGKSAMEKRLQDISSKRQKLVGFKMIDRGIAREQMPVLFEGKSIGYVTSGTFSPTLQSAIGVCFVDQDFSQVGQKIMIEIRGKPTAAEVVATPFVKQTSLKKEK